MTPRALSCVAGSMSERMLRRSAYVPAAPAERFLVPALGREIEVAIRAHGRAGARVLDVGCGDQPLRALLESVGMKYDSLDLAQNRAGTVGHLGPLALPLPDSLSGVHYDLLICTEVMEHIADWSSAWAAFAQLLAPGGRAVITVPFVYPLHEEPFDFWRPTSHALRHFASANGLRVLEERSVGDGGDVLGTLLETHWGYPAMEGPIARARAALFERVRRWLLARLHDDQWRASVEIRGPLFHGSLMVVERPLS